MDTQSSEFDELKEIVFDKELENNKKAKKRLFLLAFLIIIFLFVLIVMKFLNTATEDNKEVVLPPVPQSENISILDNAKNTQANEPLFTQVPIEETSADFEEDLEKEKLANIIKESKKEILKPVSKPQPKPLPPTKETAQKKENIVQKMASLDVKKIKAPTKTKRSKTYIQVSAMTKYQPNHRFLKKLKSEGYEYKLHEVMIKNRKIIKVLVGPYDTQKNLSGALKQIRKNIKDAFVYRVK
jgi:DedD protein